MKALCEHCQRWDGTVYIGSEGIDYRLLNSLRVYG